MSARRSTDSSVCLSLWDQSFVVVRTTLADIAENNGEEIVPIGLIGSYWGGTTIEAWLPNSTQTPINSCRGSTGNKTGPQTGVNGGELFNGMVMPFSKMAIKGALWCKKDRKIERSSLRHARGPACCMPSMVLSYTSYIQYACTAAQTYCTVLSVPSYYHLCCAHPYVRCCDLGLIPWLVSYGGAY